MFLEGTIKIYFIKHKLYIIFVVFFHTRMAMKIREWRLAREDAAIGVRKKSRALLKIVPKLTDEFQSGIPIDYDEEYMAAAALAADDLDNMKGTVFKHLTDSGYLQSSEQSGGD